MPILTSQNQCSFVPRHDIFDNIVIYQEVLHTMRIKSRGKGIMLMTVSNATSSKILSRPVSRSDPIGGSKPSSGCETQDWDSLPNFFFKKKTNWHLWVWPTLIIIQNIIYKSKELPPEWCLSKSIHI